MWKNGYYSLEIYSRELCLHRKQYHCRNMILAYISFSRGIHQTNYIKLSPEFITRTKIIVADILCGTKQFMLMFQVCYTLNGISSLKNHITKIFIYQEKLITLKYIKKINTEVKCKLKNYFLFRNVMGVQFFHRNSTKKNI